jgi:hypothetical protein
MLPTKYDENGLRISLNAPLFHTEDGKDTTMMDTI